MSLISSLKEELEIGFALKLISYAFTEVNAVKVKKIRAMFEKNRRFYQEMTGVYHSVKISAARLKEVEKKIKTTQDYSSILHIAVTSNLRFYGMLNLNVIKKFTAESKNSKSDRLVIGQTGIDFLRTASPNQKFEETVFKKDFPSLTETRNLIEKSKKYDRVLLYYPQFLTILSQQVGILDITQSAPAPEKEREKFEYIFEPELPQILDFFESQVRTLLFNRAMLEAELSRTAARLLSMSNASQRADNLIRNKNMQLSKAQRSLKNAQLLETFAGIKKWRE